MSERFDAAFAYASAHHAEQTRKGTQIPYVAHLLAVASLVLEMQSGEEDEAIAALLHDVVEDGGGMRAAGEIMRRFGVDVMRIVLANSDTTVEPKPPWRERKAAYIAAMAHKAPDELRVSLADKLHNARAILLDYRELYDDVWSRFNARARRDTVVLRRARPCLRGAKGRARRRRAGLLAGVLAHGRRPGRARGARVGGGRAARSGIGGTTARLRWVDGAIVETRRWINSARSDADSDRGFSSPGSWDYDYSIDLVANAHQAEETIVALEAERASIRTREEMRREQHSGE